MQKMEAGGQLSSSSWQLALHVAEAAHHCVPEEHDPQAALQLPVSGQNDVGGGQAHVDAQDCVSGQKKVPLAQAADRLTRASCCRFRRRRSSISV